MKTLLALIALMVVFSGLAAGSVGDWPTAGRDFSRACFANASQSDLAGSDFTVAWTFKTNASIRTSAVAADLSGGRQLEVVFSAGSMLYALSSNGSLLWTYPVNATVRGSPSIGDLDLDGAPEILFGADNGILYALNADGSLSWLFPTGGPVTVSPALEDVNEDGFLEVLFGSWDKYLYAIEHDGSLLWNYSTGSRTDSSPAVADINRDGSKEIIFGSENNILYAVSTPPYKVWMYQTNSIIPGPPTAVDVNGDGITEILFGSEDGVVYAVYYATYSQGTESRSRLSLLWNYTTGGAVRTGIAAGSLNLGSKGLYLAFGSDDKTLYILNKTGGRLVRYTVSKPVRSTPAFADVDADSVPEVIFGSDDENVYVINRTGSTIWSYQTGGFVRSSPIAVDLEGDGGLDIVVGSDDGVLYAFQTLAASERGLGDGYYAKAEDYYLQDDINSSRSYSAKARDAYVKINYSEGLSNVAMLETKIQASEYCVQAGEAYASGDLNLSITLAALSDQTYRSVNAGNASFCSMLLGRTNADLYYLEAGVFYSNGRFDDALTYASEAQRLYTSLNNTVESGKAEALSNKTRLGVRASSYYVKAVGYYANGSYERALIYDSEALSLYLELGHESGMNSSLQLMKVVNASLYLAKAFSFYNQSLFAEANAAALTAYNLSLDVGDAAAMESAAEIMNKTSDYARAWNTLKLSTDYYNNKSFDDASRLARMALEECSKLNDSSCVATASRIADAADQDKLSVVALGVIRLLFTLLAVAAVAFGLLYVRKRLKRTVPQQSESPGMPMNYAKPSVPSQPHKPAVPEEPEKP